MQFITTISIYRYGERHVRVLPSTPYLHLRLKAKNELCPSGIGCSAKLVFCLKMNFRKFSKRTKYEFKEDPPKLF